MKQKCSVWSVCSQKRNKYVKCDVETLINRCVCSVVKVLSKRWWIPVGARLEGPKLEPEGRRAEVGFPTADHGFLSIQGTIYGI